MISRRLVLAGGLALAGGPAFAAEGGSASGGYRDGDVHIVFSHAVALLQDNAEGVLARPRQLRVLLSDVETPVSAICGLIFPPVRAMARAGKLQGVLLEFDPADQQSLEASVLLKPTAEGVMAPSLSLSHTAGLWSRLEFGPDRVTGELKPDASDRLAASFSAPVSTDPVTADIKGPAAAQSELVKVLRNRAQAFARGDMATFAQLSTPEAVDEFRSLPPEAHKAASAAIPDLLERLSATKRVVVRRQTAAVMVGEGAWATLVLVDGAWKATD